MHLFKVKIMSLNGPHLAKHLFSGQCISIGVTLGTCLSAVLSKYRLQHKVKSFPES